MGNSLLDAFSNLLQKNRFANVPIGNIQDQQLPNISPIEGEIHPSIQNQNPELQDYLAKLRQMPSLADYHPSKMRRLGSIFAGMQGGPEGQEQFKMQPYTKSYQDWAQKLGALKEGISLPSELATKEAQAQEARQHGKYFEQLGGADVTRADAYKKWVESQEPGKRYVKVGKGLFDTATGQMLDDPNQPAKLSKEEEDMDIYLQSKHGVSFDKASPQQKEEARLAIQERPTNPLAESAADERSYNIRSKEVASKVSDVNDRVPRFARLLDSLNANSPAIDPGIAAELQTTIAGGKSTGVRVTQAEISQWVGGRNAALGLRAALDKWFTTDPTKPFLFPPEQRAQLKLFVNLLMTKMKRKQDLANQADDDLAEVQSPISRRRIVNKLQRDLDKIDEESMNKPENISPETHAYFYSRYKTKHPNVNFEQFKKLVDKHNKDNGTNFEALP